MKFPAILIVSVNVVAISQVTAVIAAEEVVSDKVNWLQENLAALKRKSGKPKITWSRPEAFVSHQKVSLRAFLPNRYLPSAKELELQIAHNNLQSRSTAAFNEYNVAESTNYQRPEPLVCYGEPCNQKPKTQFKHSLTNLAAAPVIVNPPCLVSNQQCPQMLLEDPAQFLAALPSNTPERQLVVDSPVLSEEETAILNKAVDLSRPSATVRDFNGETTGQVWDNPGSGVGPPPFPLSLLPMNAIMQNLGGSARNRLSAATPARFGSWHHKEMLPAAYFHSYLPTDKGSQSTAARLSSTWVSYVPRSSRQAFRAHYSLKRNRKITLANLTSNRRTGMAQTRFAYNPTSNPNPSTMPQNTVAYNPKLKVAVYPPYQERI